MGPLVVLTLPCHQRLDGSVLVGMLEHLRHDRRWPFDQCAIQSHLSLKEGDMLHRVGAPVVGLQLGPEMSPRSRTTRCPARGGSQELMEPPKSRAWVEVIWLWMALCLVGSYLELAYRVASPYPRHRCHLVCAMPFRAKDETDLHPVLRSRSELARSWWTKGPHGIGGSYQFSIRAEILDIPIVILRSLHRHRHHRCYRRTSSSPALVIAPHPSSSPVLAVGQRRLCNCPISPALAASRRRLSHCPLPRPPHLSVVALSSSPLAATSVDAPARSNFLAGVHPCLNTRCCRPLLHRCTAVSPLLPAAAAHSCLCRLPLSPPICCLQPHPAGHLFHLSSFPCISTTTAAPPAHSPLLSPLLLPPASAAASVALSRNHRWALLTLTPQPPPSLAAVTLIGLPLISPSSLASSSDLTVAALAGASLPPFLPYATTASIATTARPFHP
ncbi:hypothetical protein B296_00018014 [Ensete ventricosum]|uniref:Uncharacterized protein n=1 Tax=Ensete ventricosum TaxID=4639 RepID=A0A426YGN9_ENSVE|nr:hypothetical protein B296_00018014 [Ensete ventricosum]